MGDEEPIHSLETAGTTIAYRRTAGRNPGLVFLGGFRSDMTGIKATALEAWAQREGRAFIRFDYQGHGASGGAWEQGSIGQWRDDALAVLDRLTDGPQILVGSSMGGWIALLVALARPDRVAGLLGIATAPDFTERMICSRLGPDQLAALERDGRFIAPSAYDPAGYPITRHLLAEARAHLLLPGPIPLTCPVRLLHGQRDPDIPWQTSLELAGALAGDDVRVVLVKDGDHRLSRDQDIALMLRLAGELAEKTKGHGT
ncbi:MULTISPECIES: alpha/beta fold hydrolase [unclassified Azospirillum]|uniref:alpha/beta fold hydrolase n=1 Tax=unclassified Azospirillum TaxID=2630922 RepID=UPI000B6C5CD9|nr:MULTISPECIES: alpha/beta hydrolase [unclassified Azospirillum]SNS91941.1 Pimeloyl-ACP methyl ester carboxylesterase [Azospirillum sp. RU38E]SNT08924.1 Pimeloyl-ACP methyl ester carboxylesterase [Azospirillum sp. RU37A]